MPSLLAADKVVARWERSGRGPLPSTGDDGIGHELLALVARARAEGLDADAELRQVLRDLDAQVRHT